MNKIINLIKWVTFGVLGLSVVFFFMPYRADTAPFVILRAVFEYGNGELIFEGIFYFILSLVFVLLPAVLLLLKLNMVTGIISVILCAVAAVIYSDYISMTANAWINPGVEIGLTMNRIISIAGAVLSLGCTVLYAVNKAKNKGK